jgi:hypothetical protein
VGFSHGEEAKVRECAPWHTRTACFGGSRAQEEVDVARTDCAAAAVRPAAVRGETQASLTQQQATARAPPSPANHAHAALTPPAPAAPWTLQPWTLQLPRSGAHIMVKSQAMAACTKEQQRAGTICVGAMMTHEGERQRGLGCWGGSRREGASVPQPPPQPCRVVGGAATGGRLAGAARSRRRRAVSARRALRVAGCAAI